mgnify:CR=1 FL=1
MTDTTKLLALALEIKKDMHEAAYNWGSALDDEESRGGFLRTGKLIAIK